MHVLVFYVSKVKKQIAKMKKQVLTPLHQAVGLKESPEMIAQWPKKDSPRPIPIR
jgi:hypothetical protein